MGAWVELLRNSDWQLAIAVTSGVLLIVQRFAHFDVPSWVVPALVAACVLFSVLSVFAIVSAWLRLRGDHGR